MENSLWYKMWYKIGRIVGTIKWELRISKLKFKKVLMDIRLAILDIEYAIITRLNKFVIKLYLLAILHYCKK